MVRLRIAFWLMVLVVAVVVAVLALPLVKRTGSNGLVPTSLSAFIGGGDFYTIDHDLSKLAVWRMVDGQPPRIMLEYELQPDLAYNSGLLHGARNAHIHPRVLVYSRVRGWTILDMRSGTMSDVLNTAPQSVSTITQVADNLWLLDGEDLIVIDLGAEEVSQRRLPLPYSIRDSGEMCVVLVRPGSAMIYEPTSGRFGQLTLVGDSLDYEPRGFAEADMHLLDASRNSLIFSEKSRMSIKVYSLQGKCIHTIRTEESFRHFVGGPPGGGSVLTGGKGPKRFINAAGTYWSARTYDELDFRFTYWFPR